MPTRQPLRTIRVILVEDHPLVRRAARRLLDAARNIRVVGEAENGHQALPLVSQLQPDVVVVDIAMPGMDGLELTEHLCRLQEFRPRVLVYSLYVAPDVVADALRKGAAGYVAKHAAAQELVAAVIAVSQGRRYLSAGTLG
jgi:DNA-binding NarL/FixJ family response regulator